MTIPTRSLIAFAVAVALAGCAAPADPGAGDGPLAVRIASGAGGPQDIAEIVDASVSGDILSVTMRHGGGCAQHDYGLVNAGIFLRSLPPQTHLTITHDAHGDPCDALIEKRLMFDLGPLRRLFQAQSPRGGDVLVLHVNAPGTDQMVTLHWNFKG